MKKIYISILGGFSFFAVAQIKTNQNVSQNAITSQTAFLDASSSTLWNTTSNQGKGMVFPRTNLTQLSTLLASPNGIGSSYPNRLDGMIVYNIGEGAPAIGAAQTPRVTEGFYYYNNKSTTLNGGHWVRIGDGSANRALLAFTDGQEVETNTTIDGAKVYAIKGSFVHDGGNSVLINKPTDFANLSQIKVYRKNGTGTDKNLVGSSLYSYEVVGNQIKLIFGQGGILSLSYPQGNYEYMLEYTK